MSNFRPTDRRTGFLMPPSVEEWLPQRHLARFVVEVIDGLDLKSMSKIYRGSGSASYHPATLLGLLGPVDKPRPDADASEQDESHEAGGELVISGGDAALLLEMPNEALNP